MKTFKWQVHIQEGFVVEVCALDVESALLLAFAKFWEQHPNCSWLAFSIEIVNLDLYLAQLPQEKTGDV